MVVPTHYTVVQCILVRFSDWSKAASSSGLGGTPSLVALDLQAAWNVGYHLDASRLVQEVVVAEEEARWSATSYSCSWTSPRTPAPWAPGSGFEADVINPFIKFLEHGNHNKVSRNLWKSQLKYRMEEVLHWSSGHSAVVALVSTWYWVCNED